MKYLVCVHAAYELTGEVRYRDAAFGLLRQIIEAGRLPWPSNPYELNHNTFYWGLLCDYWNKTEMADQADWVGCIDEYWQAMQLGLDGEGVPRAGPYDTVNRTFTPYPDRWVPREDAYLLPTLDGSTARVRERWVSSTCFPNRALNAGFAAALALLARSHGLDDDAHKLAKRTLLRLDEDTMRWWWDDGKLPHELKPLLNIYAPEVPAAWLVAYWMGRQQGVW
jgi:hypothetical protein